MFITLTLDTSLRNKSKLRLHRRRFTAATGWHKAINARRRSLWQRLKAWRRSLKSHCYKMEGQIAMF